MATIPKPIAGAVLLGIASTVIGIGANTFNKALKFERREQSVKITNWKKASNAPLLKIHFFIFVPVKMLAAILSLFFLMLSVLPCSDKAPEKLKLELEQVAHSDCENTEAGDLCSPFCHCQCCSMHYISFNVLMVKVVSPEEPQAAFVFFDDQEQEVLYSFHQPPRV